MKQFKRIISFVIALTMLVSMFSVGIVNASAETQTYILGDANQDGTVNVMDATLIQRFSASLPGSDIEEGTIEFAAADVNYDGKVTVMDATIIQRYAAMYDVTGYDIGKEFTFGDPDDNDDPTTDDPSTDDLSTEEPSTEEPSTEEPSTEEPSTEEPSTEEPSTEEPSTEEPTTEEPSTEEASTVEPEEVTAGYYLVGDLNGESLWSADALTADRKFKENPAVDGEYMLDWTFYGGDELKVVYFDGTEIKTWYNDGGDNYKIGATSDKIGDGTIYFNPDGNDSWSYKYFTVQPKGDEPTEEPSTEEPSTEEPSTEEPSTEEPSTEDPTPVTYTAYCVNSSNYATVSAHAWNTGGSGTTWPGVAMTKTDMTSPSGAAVWTYTFDTSYDNIIFNDNGKGSQTADLKFEVGKYYDLASKAWYDKLEDIPVPTLYGTGYYLPGNFNNWSQSSDEFMTDTKGGTVGTVTLTLKANTTYEFKVKSGSSWYGYSSTISGTVTDKTLSTSAGNAKVKTTVAGDYVFTFNTSTKKLSVTYPS